VLTGGAIAATTYPGLKWVVPSSFIFSIFGDITIVPVFRGTGIRP